MKVCNIREWRVEVGGQGRFVLSRSVDQQCDLQAKPFEAGIYIYIYKKVNKERGPLHGQRSSPLAIVRRVTLF